MLTKISYRRTKNNKNSVPRKENKQLSLDEIDMKILKVLSHDCRISNREIARRLQLSVNTVINRISILGAYGVLKGYKATIDFSKLGYPVAVVMEVMMRKGMIREAEMELTKLPNVCAVYDVTGRADAIVVAKFRNTDELSDFVKSIQKKGYVERTETMVVLNIEKEDFSLL